MFISKVGQCFAHIKAHTVQAIHYFSKQLNLGVTLSLERTQAIRSLHSKLRGNGF
jgi:hypothetical protein